LRDFKTRFLEWVEGNTTLKQKTKDYYENGWRLLEQTDVVAIHDREHNHEVPAPKHR